MTPFKTFAVVAVIVAAAGSALAASGEWRQDAKYADARRISRLDEAWRAALAEARADGHARELRALGALADPKVALTRPQPTPGAYRCRTIKLGSQGPGGLSYVAYGWFKCRVELTPGGDLILSKTTGSQRPSGNLYPENPSRLVFLGAISLGTEARTVRYGQDPERDQAGVFERIGPKRYRLALPWPQFESKLDLIELSA